jgi:hypothetical protein
LGWRKGWRKNAGKDGDEAKEDLGWRMDGRAELDKRKVGMQGGYWSGP